MTSADRMTRPHRGRSKLRMLKFPEQVLAQVDKMILSAGSERREYAEIAEWLKRQGYQTSKSAVARYGKFLLSQDRTKEHVKTRVGSHPGRFYEVVRELLDLYESK